MKKHLLTLILFAFVGLVAYCQTDAINIKTTGLLIDYEGNTTFDASALLQLNSDAIATQGFLAPRVLLTATNAAGPIANPANGLLVYNTNIAGTAPNNVVEGFYYNAGTSGTPNWVRLVTGGTANAWSLTGNTGTTASTSSIGIAANNNFIGTSDATDFVMTTSGFERMRIASGGNVGIGSTSPDHLLTLTKTHSAATTADMLKVNFDANWGLKLVQNYVGAGDIKYELKQVYNSTIYDVLAFKSGNVGIGSASPLVKLDIVSTDAIHLPNGTTAQRPSGVAGYLRFNNNSLGLEYHDGTQWVPVNMEQTPIGTIVPFAGPSVPTGWLLCDGAQVNRTNYTALFAAIGTAWGTGNGSTTFHLPDLRGRFPRGIDGSAGRDPDNASRTASNAGGNTANALGSVQVDANIAHTHSVSGTSAGSGVLSTSSNGNHAHNWGGNWSNDDSRAYTADNGDGYGNTISDGNFWWGGGGALFTNIGGSTDGNHSHNIWAPVNDVNSSSSQGYPNGNNHQTVRSSDRPRNSTVNCIDASGNHSHTTPMYQHRHWIKTRATTTSGAHTHTIGDHSHAFNVTSGAATGATSTESRPENAYVQYIIKATSTSTVAIVSPNIPNGINGQTLRYNSSSGLWVANSFLYNDESNIGIGTSTPTFKLDMPNSGTINARLGLAETGTWPFANTYAYWGHETLDHSAVGNYALLQSSGGITYLNSATGQAINFRENNADKMTLTGGNLGIGTTAPSVPLDVNGSFRIRSANDGSGNIRFDAGNPYIVTSSSYIHVPNGFYLNDASKTSYTEAPFMFRNYVQNDVGTNFGGDFRIADPLRIDGAIVSINNVFPPNGAIRLTPNLHLNAGNGSGIYVNWDNGSHASGTWEFVVGNGAGATQFYVTGAGRVWANYDYNIAYCISCKNRDNGGNPGDNSANAPSRCAGFGSWTAWSNQANGGRYEDWCAILLYKWY